MATLYYDGNCPLCSKEIGFLESKLGQKVRFVDIHSLGEGHVPSKVEMLKVMHLETDQGEWVYGYEANIRLWSLMPFGVLAKVLKIWPIRAVGGRFYRAWAQRRYEKLYGCKRCNS